MSSPQPPNYPSPPPIPSDSPPSTSVRRHHTISASSRAARSRPTISEEDHEPGWTNEDEVISNENWAIGGAGAVGSGLHRQSSLPSRYNRGFHPSQTVSGRRSGTHTPRTLNSLSAITAEHGLEGEGEDIEWEREISGWQGEEEPPLPSPPLPPQGSPASQGYNATDIQAVSTGASGVRRHQSLTYGAHQAKQRATTPLKRSGTMLATAPGRSSQPTPEMQDEEEEEEYVEQDFQDQPQYPQLDPQVQVQNNYPARQSPWDMPSRDWRGNDNPNIAQSYVPGIGGQLDDVQRALASLEISSGQPPRFNTAQNMQTTNLRSSVTGFSQRDNQLGLGGNPQIMAGGMVSQYGTGLSQGTETQSNDGPAKHSRRSASASGEDSTSFINAASDRNLRTRNSNPNLNYTSNLGMYGVNPSNMPPVPIIPAQYVNQFREGQPPRLGLNNVYGPHTSIGASKVSDQMLASSLDVPTLIATKGYNPTAFDTQPKGARYFVIKSYTEDDVHKSLKYEIWSSTDPGNKRLDKAFKECAGRGQIYLFFSVNASGHFCGVAEMLTPVDYTRSSTVWASDKWKGVFKVRWIFVRDIPNASLRHIKLINTQERKPVTNSRDTQELLPEAGQEMLRIFHTHPARTSLLQDFAFYELQAMQKNNLVTTAASSETQSPPGSPTAQSQNPPTNHQQHPFAMSNTAALNYMQQYQLGASLNGMPLNIGTGYSHPQAIRSVMRDHSQTNATRSYDEGRF